MRSIIECIPYKIEPEQVWRPKASSNIKGDVTLLLRDEVRPGVWRLHSASRFSSVITGEDLRALFYYVGSARDQSFITGLRLDASCQEFDLVAPQPSVGQIWTRRAKNLPPISFELAVPGPGWWRINGGDLLGAPAVSLEMLQRDCVHEGSQPARDDVIHALARFVGLLPEDFQRLLEVRYPKGGTVTFNGARQCAIDALKRVQIDALGERVIQNHGKQWVDQGGPIVDVPTKQEDMHHASFSEGRYAPGNVWTSITNGPCVLITNTAPHEETWQMRRISDGKDFFMHRDCINRGRWSWSYMGAKDILDRVHPDNNKITIGDDVVSKKIVHNLQTSLRTHTHGTPDYSTLETTQTIIPDYERKAIDGVDGGLYEPTSKIEVSGQGIELLNGQALTIQGGSKLEGVQTITLSHDICDRPGRVIYMKDGKEITKEEYWREEGYRKAGLPLEPPKRHEVKPGQVWRAEGIPCDLVAVEKVSRCGASETWSMETESGELFYMNDASKNLWTFVREPEPAAPEPTALQLLQQTIIDEAKRPPEGITSEVFFAFLTRYVEDPMHPDLDRQKWEGYLTSYRVEALAKELRDGPPIRSGDPVRGFVAEMNWQLQQFARRMKGVAFTMPHEKRKGWWAR